MTTSCWYDEIQYLDLVKNCILDSAELVKLGKNQVDKLDAANFRGVTFLMKHLDLLPEKVWDLCNEDEIADLMHGWADICNWIAEGMIYRKLTVWEKFKVISNLYKFGQKLFEDKTYFMFEVYLRMTLLSKEFVGYYAYGEKDFQYDNQLLDLMDDVLKEIANYRSLSRDEKNLCDRIQLIFPGYAGQICLKGILRSKGEDLKTYQDAYVRALKYGIDLADKIIGDSDFSDYDRNLLNHTIREMGIYAQTLVSKDLLKKYRITDLRERIMQIPENEYMYTDLGKCHLSLGMDYVQYLNSKQKVPRSLVEKANDLYDAVQSELQKTKDAHARYALVSYLTSIPPIYMRYVCGAMKKNVYILEKENEELLKKVMYIYELYEKNQFYSHELQFYMNALVTYAASYYNRGQKEIGAEYFRKTLEKYEYYARKPHFRETSDLLSDKFNANYSLCLYYAEKGKTNTAMQHLRAAQKIYAQHQEVRRIYSVDREIRYLMEQNPMFQRLTFQPQSQSTKVGRNELCPCGSGKKYKQCCGKNK